MRIGAARCAQAGASYPHSFVVDSLCCVSRASFFTGQYPHQTGVRTNTSNKRDPVEPLGGWPAFDALRQPRARVQRAAAGGRLHDRLRRQVPQRVRVRARAGRCRRSPPGWTTFNVVFGSAYDGWDFASTSPSTRRLRAASSTPRRRRARATAEQGRGVRRHRDRRRWRWTSSRAHEADRRAVLPRGGALRAAQPRPARGRTTPATRCFPPMFRDRPSRQAAATAAASPCGELTSTTCPASATRRDDNRPRRRDGEPAPGRGTPRRALPRRAQPSRDLRNRARMAQSVDRLRAAGSSLRRRRTPTSCSPPTTASTSASTASAAARARRTTPTCGCRCSSSARASCRARATRWSPATSTSRRPSRSSPGCAPAPTAPALARRRPSRDPTLVAAHDYVFLEHTQQALTGADPDAAFDGASSTGSRRTSRCAAARRCSSRFDLDPRRRQVTYGYEFYELQARPLRADATPSPSREYAAEVAAADGEARRLRRLLGSAGDDAGAASACRVADRQ